MADVANIESLTVAGSGSVGDVVFAHNQFGPYRRSRTVPTDPNSPFQQVVRAAVATLTARWRDTLTNTQRAGWDLYAKNVLLLARIGRRTNAGGLGMYVRSNVPRIQAAEPTLQVVDTAPTTFDLSPLAPFTRVVLNVIDDVFYPFTVAPDDWILTYNSALLFYASPPQPLTVNFWKGPYRYAGAVLSRTVDATHPPAVIPLPFPAGTGQRVFIRARCTRGDGRLTSSIRLPANYLPQIAPVPLYAYGYTVPFLRCDVTFDRPLTPAVIDKANWSLRWRNYRAAITSATHAGSIIRLLFTRGFLDPGPNVVSYSPPPFDVTALYTSVPAAPFTNFPVYG